jgi:hypothetical protein
MPSDFELEPRYSTTEIPGKCIKCLAEQQYRDCLRALLDTGGQGEELQETYKALVSFLQSPELLKVRDECERHLAEGREVKAVLRLAEGQLRYEIKTGQQADKGA